MSILDRLQSHEKIAIEELQQRFEKVLPPDVRDDESLFYRFLKARNFDLNKAEALLKKHLDWRKAFQIHTILKTFQPTEFCLKYVPVNFVAFDKESNLVLYHPTGFKDPKEVMQSMKLNDFVKYIVWTIEKYKMWLKNESKKTGRSCFQATLIFDLDGVTLATIRSKETSNAFIRLLFLLQDNYPELLKNIYVINAPAYFTILYFIIRRFMSHETQNKFRVFGNNGWKEALLKAVDADELPDFFGGNKTDPDGNSFINLGGPIPPKYFLSPEERYFKDKDRVKSVIVPYSDAVKIPVEVQECNSLVQWEFETKSKDIGFGLFLQKSEDELEELLPIQKFITQDGTETGSFNAVSVGTYVIIFDNSYSWLTSKEVSYCITVKAQN